VGRISHCEHKIYHHKDLLYARGRNPPSRLDRDRADGLPYHDNLCFFRALALFKALQEDPTATTRPTVKSTKLLFERWLVETKSNALRENFKGVDLIDIPSVEEVNWQNRAKQ
jgi:hypothetical protein